MQLRSPRAELALALGRRSANVSIDTIRTTTRGSLADLTCPEAHNFSPSSRPSTLTLLHVLVARVPVAAA
jgi:hypothetical protein